MQLSVVNYKSLEKVKRYDAEYFSEEALNNDSLLLSKKYSFLGDIAYNIVSGPFGSTLKSDAYLNSGIPFIRIRDLQNFFISDNSLIYISKEDNRRLLSSQLCVGDLVLSKVGNTIGVVSIVTEDLGKCNISENNIGIKLKTISDIDKNFLLTFLNGIFGQIQILRRISGNAQPKLNTSDIGSVIIPDMSNAFKLVISNVVKNVKKHIDDSKHIYCQAEHLLLDELGLSDWQAKHELSFVRKFSDTQQSERIDAEYLQPKYDQIINVVKNYKYRWAKLGDIVKITKSVEPGSNEYLDNGTKFLRISNLSKFGTNNSSPVYLSERFYILYKHLQPQKGEILLTKDGTPGIAYYINEVPEKMLVSSGILRLKLMDNRINEEFLNLALNSVIVQKQADRDAGGSVIKHWRIDQIKNVAIPIFNVRLQTKIKQHIGKSFKARAESERLLVIAKSAVEMAIEKDEKTAMEWLEEQGI